MTESEARTRKERIDARLRSPVLDWIIVPNDEVRDFSSLARHAVEEYPTETGPAYYALFVDGKLLAVILGRGTQKDDRASAVITANNHPHG